MGLSPREIIIIMKMTMISIRILHIQGVPKKTWFQKFTAVRYSRQMLAILGNFELFGQFCAIWVNSGHFKQFWALGNVGQF